MPGSGKGQDTSDANMPMDAGKKFVRVEKVRADGFVAFEFAIGEPDICVELLLPQDAFTAFCREHEVVDLSACPPGRSANDLEWRLRDAADFRRPSREPYPSLRTI